MPKSKNDMATPSITLHHGDCLEKLKLVEPMSAQAVITDPPYMIGSISVGDPSSKSGTWADMENSAYWFSAWINQCKQILKPDGYIVVFGNWRSIPTLVRAFALAEVQVQSCMIWDKQWIGTGGPAALRPVYEIAMFAAMPEGKIRNRSAKDIYTCKWMAGNMKESKHPAEKPVQLMQHIIQLVAPDGGLIVDPFMGSGTTGRAAFLQGCDFVGIEREAEWVQTAKQRIFAPSQAALDV